MDRKSLNTLPDSQPSGSILGVDYAIGSSSSLSVETSYDSKTTGTMDAGGSSYGIDFQGYMDQEYKK